MRALPRAGITFVSALNAHELICVSHPALRTHLYRSYPAERAEPRVGRRAFSECRLMRSPETGASSDLSSGMGVTLRFLF